MSCLYSLKEIRLGITDAITSTQGDICCQNPLCESNFIKVQGSCLRLVMSRTNTTLGLSPYTTYCDMIIRWKGERHATESV